MTTKISKNVATADFVKHPEITYISKAGHNSLFVVIGGRLYSTHGTNTSFSTATSGRGTTGQCGYYGLDNLKLVDIPTHSPIKKVTTGFNAQASCLLENGNLYVWGSNDSGQLGLGTTTDVGYPTLTANDVVDVYEHTSNGEYHVANPKMIILKTDGLLYASGFNSRGQLGVGDTSNRSTWTQVLNITAGTVKSVWNLGCHKGALVVQKTDNTVWVCGYNGNGALGNATTTDQTQLIDLTSAWIPSTSYEVKNVSYSSSYYDTVEQTRHTMGIFSDDGVNQTLRMCGYNGHGQLGDTTTTQRTTPITPTGIPSSGLVEYHGFSALLCSKLLTSTGDLWSWGYNGYGQVGDGTTTQRTTPTVVTTGVNKLLEHGSVSHNYGYRCQSFIYKDDRFVYGAGNNDTGGYLGIGNTTTSITSYTKMKLDLLSGEIPIHMGGFTSTSSGITLVLSTNYNNLYAWGYNTYYGMHPQNAVHVLVPVQVNLPKTKD